MLNQGQVTAVKIDHPASKGGHRAARRTMAAISNRAGRRKMEGISNNAHRNKTVAISNNVHRNSTAPTPSTTALATTARKPACRARTANGTVAVMPHRCIVTTATGSPTGKRAACHRHRVNTAGCA